MEWWLWRALQSFLRRPLYARFPPEGEVPAPLVATPVELTRIPVGRPSPVCPPEADVNRVPQEAVGPGPVGDLGDKLWLDPVHTRKNQRRTEPPLRSGGTLRGDVLLVGAPGGVQIGKNLEKALLGPQWLGE